MQYRKRSAGRAEQFIHSPFVLGAPREHDLFATWYFERVSEGEVHEHSVGVEIVERYPALEQVSFPCLLPQGEEQSQAPASGEERVHRRPVAGQKRKCEVVTP